MTPAVARWVAVRLVALAGTVVAVALLVWCCTYLLAGDPAVSILGATATPERVAALRSERGLDRPLLAQFVEWLGGVARGDWGTSIVSRRPIADTLWPRVTNSAAIAACSGVLTLLLGIPLGVAAAGRARWIGSLALVLAAIPEFVTGTLLVGVFALDLQWLPALSTIPRGQTVWSDPSRLVIPVVALTCAVVGWCIRHVRGVVAAHLDSPAAVAARINGVPEREVVRRIVLPEAIAPLVGFLGWLIGGLVAASAVIEQLVGFPGIGAYLVESVTFRDLPAVAAAGTVLGAIVASAVMICDFLAASLDPRLRPWRRPA